MGMLSITIGGIKLPMGDVPAEAIEQSKEEKILRRREDFPFLSHSGAILTASPTENILSPVRKKQKRGEENRKGRMDGYFLYLS